MCEEDHELIKQVTEDHATFVRKLGEMNSAIDVHINRDHVRLDEANDALHVAVEELACGMFGPQRSDIAGGGRVEEEGLTYRVGQMWTASQNGGFHMKPTKGMWAAVLTPTVAIIADIIHAVLTHSPL